MVYNGAQDVIMTMPQTALDMQSAQQFLQRLGSSWVNIRDRRREVLKEAKGTNAAASGGGGANTTKRERDPKGVHDVQVPRACTFAVPLHKMDEDHE
jgi:hypothetical protein